MLCYLALGVGLSAVASVAYAQTKPLEVVREQAELLRKQQARLDALENAVCA